MPIAGGIIIYLNYYVWIILIFRLSLRGSSYTMLQAMGYDLLSSVSASSKIDPVKNTYTIDSNKDSSLDDNKKEVKHNQMFVC